MSANTPLHNAVIQDNYPKVKALLAEGADMFAIGDNGLTPVDLCGGNTCLAIHDLFSNAKKQRENKYKKSEQLVASIEREHKKDPSSVPIQKLGGLMADLLGYIDEKEYLRVMKECNNVRPSKGKCGYGHSGKFGDFCHCGSRIAYLD
jgi:hypothetical protein